MSIRKLYSCMHPMTSPMFRSRENSILKSKVELWGQVRSQVQLGNEWRFGSQSHLGNTWIRMGLLCVALSVALHANAEDRVTLSLWAAQATQEGKTPKEFDPGLEPITNAVADLPFDTYKKILATKQSIVLKKETKIPVESRYSLCITPMSKESDGRMRMDIRVEITPKTPGDKPVVALSTRLMLSPGKLVKLGGFPLEKGELIIVLSAIP